MRSFALFLLLLVGGFFAGLWVGRQGASQNVTALRDQVQVLDGQRAELEEALMQTHAGAKTAILRFEQLQDSVEEAIPAGPMEDLVALLHRQIKDGADPKRLAFVIQSSRPPQNCAAPQSRRFVISTPAYKGVQSTVEVGEGLVRIQGAGVSAQSQKGLPEAWYDPTKKVSIDFTLSDGRIETRRGVLPIHNSIVLNDREYRFTVEAGAKSFARVTFDSCDYP